MGPSFRRLRNHIAARSTEYHRVPISITGTAGGLVGQGVFAVDRGIFDHLIFADEPYTEREAWLWLVGEAAWKPKRIRTPHGMVQLERGQLVHSQRFLAEKWRWDRSRVRNFLALLDSEKMATQLRPSLDPASTQQKAQVTNILTICNYDKYQFGGPSVEPSSSSGNERETNQKRPKEEELINNNQEESKKETREIALSDDWPPDYETIFWTNWPNKVGKPAALKALSSARKRRCSFIAIMSGIQNYIREKPPDRPWLNPSTYLNQNRWEDQPAQVQNGKTSNVIQAADNLVSILDSFNRGSGESHALCSAESAANVRFLPQRRSE
jgi:hypothetical protein